MLFGGGYGLIGVSWIYVSIYQYGHLNSILAAFITLLFILYYAFFYGLMAYGFNILSQEISSLLRPLLFSATWCALEWFRSHLFGGFPWLVVGFSSLRTPFENILPYLGVYGAGFFMVFCVTSLAEVCFHQGLKRLYAIIPLAVIAIIAWLPMQKNPPHAHQKLEVAILQPNAMMPDKWDEGHFWQQFYSSKKRIDHLLAPDRLIILPEAAITLPTNYMQEELNDLSRKARVAKSAIALGIPVLSETEDDSYYNSITTLGRAEGQYYKQQLVPFGEYIPSIWLPLIRSMGIPMVNTTQGSENQKPLIIFGQPVAHLICYELAYPELLRRQLPEATYILSITEDGWFGHSLALYQHLEMAQVLSFMSKRDQVFVNNNGLSSHIDSHGVILTQLPAWESTSRVVTMEAHDTLTPWMNWGDLPILSFISFLLMTALSYKSLTFLLKNVKPIARQL
jgi:apolipoprotein N-acyltransferase